MSPGLETPGTTFECRVCGAANSVLRAKDDRIRCHSCDTAFSIDLASGLPPERRAESSSLSRGADFPSPAGHLRRMTDLVAANLKTIAAYIEDHRRDLSIAAVDAALERIDALRDQVVVSRTILAALEPEAPGVRQTSASVPPCLGAFVPSSRRSDK